MPLQPAQESLSQQLLLPLSPGAELEPFIAVGVYEHATKILGALTLMSQANSYRGYEWAVANVPEVQEKVFGKPEKIARNAHERGLVLFSAARTMLYEASGYKQLIKAGQIDSADAELQEISLWYAFKEKYMGPRNRSEREKYRRQLSSVIRAYEQDLQASSNII